MIILGIDPGTTRAGYGIIRGDKKPELLECGLLKIKSKGPSERMTEAAIHFRALIAKYRPDIVAVEKLFFMNNQKTGMAVAEIRGALRLLTRECNINFLEFAPTEIKKTVTGFGGADKIAIHKMVCISLGLKKIPGTDDVSDALAVALTALYHKPFA
ncbi:MAG TPA: crossover junction endodeoxyribonuclease RuvC [Candidatus Paceibacterota bacterium]